MTEYGYRTGRGDPPAGVRPAADPPPRVSSPRGGEGRRTSAGADRAATGFAGTGGELEERGSLPTAFVSPLDWKLRLDFSAKYAGAIRRPARWPTVPAGEDNQTFYESDNKHTIQAVAGAYQASIGIAFSYRKTGADAAERPVFVFADRADTFWANGNGFSLGLSTAAGPPYTCNIYKHLAGVRTLIGSFTITEDPRTDYVDVSAIVWTLSDPMKFMVSVNGVYSTFSVAGLAMLGGGFLGLYQPLDATGTEHLYKPGGLSVSELNALSESVLNIGASKVGVPGDYSFIANLLESGGRAVNRLLAKALAGDSDNLDGLPEGVTYKRLLMTHRRQLLDRKRSHGGNVLTEEGFEDGGVFWTQGAGISYPSNSANAHTGNRYLEVTTAVAFDVFNNDGEGTAHLHEVQPGDVVQFGGYCGRVSGDGSCFFNLVTVDKDGVGVSGNGSTAITAAPYQLSKGEITIPAGVKYVRLKCTATGMTASSTYRWDDAFLKILRPTDDVLAGSLRGGVNESGGKALNRLYAKALAADPDTADAIAVGTLRDVVKLTALTSGEVDFSKAGVLNRVAVNLLRTGGGATVQAILQQLTDVGHAGSAMQESGGKLLNRLLAKALAADPDSLDGTPDGTTYKRILNVLNGIAQTTSLADELITFDKLNPGNSDGFPDQFGGLGRDMIVLNGDANLGRRFWGFATGANLVVDGAAALGGANNTFKLDSKIAFPVAEVRQSVKGLNAANGAGNNESHKVRVRPGDKIRVWARGKVSAAGQQLNLSFYRWDLNRGDSLGGLDAAVLTWTELVGTQKEAVYTVPANCYYVTLSFWMSIAGSVGSGWIGEIFAWRVKMDAEIDSVAGSKITGALASGVTESGGKAVNRLLAKSLASDPDTLESVPDGTTRKLANRVKVINQQANVTVDNAATLTSTVPASTLGTDGQTLRVTIRGHKAATAGTPNLVVKFGSATILTTPLLIGGTSFEAICHVHRTGAVAQASTGRSVRGDGTLAQTFTTPVETLSGAVNITVNSSTADQITVDSLTVEYLAA